jgi:hypothetical protein
MYSICTITSYKCVTNTWELSEHFMGRRRRRRRRG